MKAELLNHNQQVVGSWEAADTEQVRLVLSQLPAEEDSTLTVEQADSVLAIAIDRGRYTLFVQLGDDEFYDFVSATSANGDVEFVEGGQRVFIDRQQLAPLTAVMDAVRDFADSPAWVRDAENWRRQV